MQGSTYTQKPDLVLIDNVTVTVDELTWLSPKIVREFMKESFQPAGHLGKTMDMKAYLMFVEQPWRRFMLGLSIANNDLCFHFYDHTGSAISPPFNIHEHPNHLIYILSALAFGYHSCLSFNPSIRISPPPVACCSKLCFLACLMTMSSCSPPNPFSSLSSRLSSPSICTVDGSQHTLMIGTIQVGDMIYDLIDILFSSPSFLGRGTICYLTCHNGCYYVIKDSWVWVPTGMLDQTLTDLSQNPALNEVRIMQHLSHIDGVPRLHGWWFVQVDKEDDTTQRYREEKWQKKIKVQRVHLCRVMTPYARPLTEFKSKKELVSCVRDIL